VKRTAGILVSSVAGLLLLSVGAALTDANSVTASAAGRNVTTINANVLKPSTCSALTLTTTVAGVTGTAGNDLLLGGSGADNMNAAGGNDCVVGGGGNDTINGGAGTDVCIGGAGTDTFSNCETQIQ
jgi:Ca2+-binding RTX toxin-like protein